MTYAILTLLPSKINVHLEGGTVYISLIATNVLIEGNGAPTLQTLLPRRNGRSKSSQQNLLIFMCTGVQASVTLIYLLD